MKLPHKIGLTALIVAAIMLLVNILPFAFELKNFLNALFVGLLKAVVFLIELGLLGYGPYWTGFTAKTHFINWLDKKVLPNLNIEKEWNMLLGGLLSFFIGLVFFALTYWLLPIEGTWLKKAVMDVTGWTGVWETAPFGWFVVCIILVVAGYLRATYTVVHKVERW